jgi:hypothetical protein
MTMALIGTAVAILVMPRWHDPELEKAGKHPAGFGPP